MDPDRKIGRVVKVKTYQALVELLPETSSYAKSSYGGVYAIAAVNSYVILPIGSERVVAVVTGLDMVEEQEMRYQSRQMLVLPNSRRTMWVSMIGTIAQIPSEQRKRFEYGIRRYPELDNPVWFATEEDLDIVFEKNCADTSKSMRLVPIGKSPLFPDYEVRIDMDRFFGKHAAILGNTGSGKSCTVTALIKAVLGRPGLNGMPHAHFIVFDTNAEYEAAFTRPTNGAASGAEFLHNRLVISNDGDNPTGMWIPHWFMNGRDYAAFFRPGEGAQAPLLHQAIGAARAGAQAEAGHILIHTVMETVIGLIEDIVSNPPRGNRRWRGRPDVREQVQSLKEAFQRHRTVLTDCGLNESVEIYESALAKLEEVTASTGQFEPNPDARFCEACLEQIAIVRQRLDADMTRPRVIEIPPVGIDTPVHFDFGDFVRTVVRTEIECESKTNPNIRAYTATLLMRLEEALQDPRYAFMFRVPSFEAALASFLRLVFGVNPSHNFHSSNITPPWSAEYLRQYPDKPDQHQVTILDFSRLASDVLENVTALVGRLILEFMQRCPNRGKYPVVLILEEAHRYIPATVVFERQQRAREVFERIAKEGRKYGLSLVVASQRPSELSKTVVSQCNSFIIHRIQNPDDREYFKSVIPDINRDLLDQLPALPQQHALVIGDCITVPMQVRINDVDPKPHSHDPEFFRVWANPDSTPPDFEAICAKWEGDGSIARVDPKDSPHASGESEAASPENADWADVESLPEEGWQTEEDNASEPWLATTVIISEPDWLTEHEPDLSNAPPENDEPF